MNALFSVTFVVGAALIVCPLAAVMISRPRFVSFSVPVRVTAAGLVWLFTPLWSGWLLKAAVPFGLEPLGAPLTVIIALMVITAAVAPTFRQVRAFVIAGEEGGL
jgi:hypothetical protein